MGKFSGTLDKFVVVIAETDSDWQLVGQVKPTFRKGDLEGEVRLVGKVKKSWPAGESKPIMDFAASFMSRRDRRKKTKTETEPLREDQVIEGPAIHVDLLAIYT